MNKLETYLRECYAKTKWTYHGLLQSKQEVGESYEADVKELRDKEMIQPTPGVNGWLIEMINIHELWKM